MTDEPLRVLLVEDNPGDARLLHEMLAEAGAVRFKVTRADRLSTGLQYLAEAGFDVVLLDLSLPDSRGLDTHARMQAAAKGVPIVVLTGLEDEALGVKLVQAGAQDYLVKGQISSALLVRSLRYATERKQAERRLALYREIIAKSSDAIAIIDLQGRYLEQNAAHGQLLGFSDDQLRGRSPVIHLGDGVFSGIAQELARGGSYRGEVASRTAGGAFVDIELSAFAVRNEAGEPVCYVGIMRDITVRKRVEKELVEIQAALRENREALRALAARLLTAQEEERRRVSRELHDDMNQKLAMLVVEVEALERHLPPSPDLIRRQLQSLGNRVAELSDDIRRLAYQLHPSILDHLGLAIALQSYVDDFAMREGIKVAFSRQDLPNSLPQDIATCLYRVTQESLRNVAKHARAAQVTISLTGSDNGVLLSIKDSGVGFEPGLVKDRRSGLGFISMQERVRLVNGSFTVHSQPGFGTQVLVWVPLPGKAP